MATIETVSATKFDEAKLRRIIRTQFESTADYQAGFQRAVHPDMQETAISSV